MVSNNNVNFEDLLGEDIIRKLDKSDQNVKEHHLKLNDQSLQLFKQFMVLFSELMVSIYREIPGFVPEFKRGTDAMRVVLASAVGSFRSLRIAHKLLMEGYYPEMHCIARMVEQWLECSVIVEGDPASASLIWKHGLNKKRKAISAVIKNIRKSNKELGDSLNNMEREFQILSQRCHPLKAAFRLITFDSEKGIDFMPGGLVDRQLFTNNALNLALLAMNALNVLKDQFRTLPADWESEFYDVRREALKNQSQQQLDNSLRKEPES